MASLNPGATSSSRDTTARDEVTLLVSTTGVVNLALGVHVVEVLHITERRASVEIPSLSIKSGTYSPPQVDRKFDIWGSCYKKPKGIFYLLRGDSTT